MQRLAEANVAEIVAKVGPPRAGGRKLALDVDRVSAMRQTGFSFAQIAEYFGVSLSTVKRRLIGR